MKNKRISFITAYMKENFEDGEVNLLMIMQVTLYSIKNIMIEEKSTEIEGKRFPIKRERSKSPIK